MTIQYNNSHQQPSGNIGDYEYNNPSAPVATANESTWYDQPANRISSQTYVAGSEPGSAYLKPSNHRSNPPSYSGQVGSNIMPQKEITGSPPQINPHQHPSYEQLYQQSLNPQENGKNHDATAPSTTTSTTSNILNDSIPAHILQQKQQQHYHQQQKQLQQSYGANGMDGMGFDNLDRNSLSHGSYSNDTLVTALMATPNDPHHPHHHHHHHNNNHSSNNGNSLGNNLGNSLGNNINQQQQQHQHAVGSTALYHGRTNAGRRDSATSLAPIPIASANSISNQVTTTPTGLVAASTPIMSSSVMDTPVSAGMLKMDDDDESDMEEQRTEKRAGRRKIRIEYIEDKSRRHITFSKRKAGIMKKAYELSTLTGTQVLLLVASETGHVYTFATPKLQPLITKAEGKNLIQACLNAPDHNQSEYAQGHGGYENDDGTLDDRQSTTVVGNGGGGSHSSVPANYAAVVAGLAGYPYSNQNIPAHYQAYVTAATAAHHNQYGGSAGAGGGGNGSGGIGPSGYWAHPSQGVIGPGPSQMSGTNSERNNSSVASHSPYVSGGDPQVN